MQTGSNVIEMRRCNCGRPARPRELSLSGVVVGTADICSTCVRAADDELAKVRPVFDAMIACDTSRERANCLMTMLLSATDEELAMWRDVVNAR